MERFLLAGRRCFWLFHEFTCQNQNFNDQWLSVRDSEVLPKKPTLVSYECHDRKLQIAINGGSRKFVVCGLSLNTIDSTIDYTVVTAIVT